jgi:hypothetical protein
MEELLMMYRNNQQANGRVARYANRAVFALRRPWR